MLTLAGRCLLTVEQHNSIRETGDVIQPRILSKNTFLECLKPRTVIQSHLVNGDVLPQVSTPLYGLGIMQLTYRGIKLYFHLGAAIGFESVIGWLPEQGTGIIALSNMSGPDDRL